MAAALPAINVGGSRVNQSPSVTINQPHVPDTPSTKLASATMAKMKRNANKRNQSKKEKVIAERHLFLRGQLPDLSKRETDKYRNTCKHNIYVDMLSEGFHKSFAEMFDLIKQQNDRRNEAGPESSLWAMILLENEPEKLQTLKTFLTQAESALRRANFAEVYKCKFKLAQYFQGTGDKWLADHFFAACLEVTKKVKNDGGKMEAEGHCNVGLAQEESGEIFEAAQNFEAFYELCKDHPYWELDGGKPMHPEACNHLSRIYTTIAATLDHDSQDIKKQIVYLKKAYDMSKEVFLTVGGDTRLAGEASYRLGEAHLKNNAASTALHYLMSYFETCRTLEDSSGTGKACEAIAKAYEKQEKIEESIKYLEMFVEIAEKSKDERAVSRASSSLGGMFNALGRYELAVEHFNRAYNIARSLGDNAVISASRVLFGMANAHKMMSNFSRHVETANNVCIERLMEWKDNRGDEFEKDPKGTAAKSPEPSPSTESTEKSDKSDSAEKSESKENAEGSEEEAAATETEGEGDKETKEGSTEDKEQEGDDVEQKDKAE